MSKINILMHIPLYFDVQLSGGEATAKDFAEYLHSTGDYNVRVLVERANKIGLNNIPIYVEDLNNDNVNHLYRWANVIYTHLGKQGKAVNYANNHKKPVFIYMHNTNGSALARSRKHIGVLYNSYFTKNIVGKDFEGNPNALVRPLLNLDVTDVEGGEYVTLINLNENKGGLLLRQIAEELPDVKFLAVTGGYAKQFTQQPSNVTVLPQQNNMLEVYKKTKILIMPSTYESYGRTAAEALGHNIPVLYSNHNTALDEVVGNAGEPVNNRNNIASWVKGIKWIDSNIIHYRLRAKEQKEYLLMQIDRDRANFDAFIKNITFGETKNR